MTTPEAIWAEWERSLGKAPNGVVTFRHFDEGLVLTMGAKVANGPPDNTPGYYLTIPSVKPPPDCPGVPVTFAAPEEMIRHKKVPYIGISRDDNPYAPQRKHPGSQQYRVAARTALPAQVGTETGYSKMEIAEQAEPYDLAYTVTVTTTRRGGVLGVPDDLLAMQYYLARKFPPFGEMFVIDSIGDGRIYKVFNDGGQTPADDVLDIGLRFTAFTFSLRVEAEIDLRDPATVNAATSRLTQRFRPR